MNPEIQAMIEWADRKTAFCQATVVQTWGSAPRGVGSLMIIDGDLRVAGSVSGGCIEGAVIEESRAVLRSGVPKELQFGVSDETAWSVGLTCGGKVSVFLERHISQSADGQEQEIWADLRAAICDSRPVILLTRLNPQTYSHLLLHPDGSKRGDWGALTAPAVAQAMTQYRQRCSARVEIAGEPLFIHVFPRREKLLIIGAAHISIPLVKLARDLDLEVVVIDPRKIFATAERFPVPPDRLITVWPDEALAEIDLNEDTYAVLLTHDPKIDDVALHILLRSPVAYIGALGSRKTHQKRCRRLQEAGFTEKEIAAIRGPAGIDISAQTPEEIALSIAAQITEVRRSRSG